MVPQSTNRPIESLTNGTGCLCGAHALDRRCHGRDDFVLFADGAGQVKYHFRMASSGALQHVRQVALQMAALSEKDRHDRDVSRSARDDFIDGRFKGGVHEFQERRAHNGTGLTLHKVPAATKAK